MKALEKIIMRDEEMVDLQVKTRRVVVRCSPSPVEGGSTSEDRDGLRYWLLGYQAPAGRTSTGMGGGKCAGRRSGHLSNRWRMSGRWPVDGAPMVDSNAEGMPAGGVSGSC